MKWEDFKFSVGQKVAKLGGDYIFYGEVVTAFYKTTGLKRYVVENEDGMLFIFNEDQLQALEG